MDREADPGGSHPLVAGSGPPGGIRRCHLAPHPEGGSGCGRRRSETCKIPPAAADRRSASWCLPFPGGGRRPRLVFGRLDEKPRIRPWCEPRRTVADYRGAPAAQLRLRSAAAHDLVGVVIPTGQGGSAICPAVVAGGGLLLGALAHHGALPGSAPRSCRRPSRSIGTPGSVTMRWRSSPPVQLAVVRAAFPDLRRRARRRAAALPRPGAVLLACPSSSACSSDSSSHSSARPLVGVTMRADQSIDTHRLATAHESEPGH